MHAFLSRLRSIRDSSSSSPSASAQTTPASPETGPEQTPPPPGPTGQPTEANTNAGASPLTRKIHPNLDELASQKDQQAQPAEGKWNSISEFGQVPAALARVANRQATEESTSKTGSPSVPPTSFSSDFQRHAERRSLVRRASAPYLHTKDATWSTFGRKNSHPPVSLSRASSSPSRSKSRPPTANQSPVGDKDSNNQGSAHVSAPESPVASIQTSGIPSNSSNNHNSSSPAVSNVSPDRKDTPPRRSTKSSPDVQYPSLPSTFGRGSSRPVAAGVFHSEPTPVSSKSGTRPTSAQSLRSSAEGDPHKPNMDASEKKLSISKATGSITQVSLRAPPLTDSNIERGSTGRPQTTGTDWMSNLSIRGILHFPSTTPNEAEKQARLEQAVRIRERRRTLSASSTGKRRSISSSSSANAWAVSGRKLKEKMLIPAQTITQVFSVTTPKSLPQLNVLLSPPPAPSQQQTATAPVASTSTQLPATASPANTDDDQLSPPTLSVTAPTPTPSPSTSRVRNNGVPATELGALRVPPKRDRHVSLAVTGKRKAEDESEVDDEAVRRRWSDIPSSYPRKKMRLSGSNESSPHRFGSTPLRGGRPVSVRSGSASTVGGGSRSARMQNASQTSIPISAIISPRPPSRHQQSSSSTTKGHNPLKNKYQELSWVESWHVNRDDMPIHGWLFLGGFVLPIFWWVGALLPLPPSGGGDELEWVAYETRWRARNWRVRCIIASVVSTVIYVPVITCAVIFSRSQSNGQHSFSFGNTR